MQVLFTFEGQTLVVKLIGELDEHCAELVRRKMDAAIQEKSFSAMVLDLSRMSFMDSTGIGVLVGRYRKFRNDVAFFIADPNATVDKILRLSGIYMIMPRIETA